LGRLNPEKGASVWEVKNDKLENPQFCYEGENIKGRVEEDKGQQVRRKEEESRETTHWQGLAA
jgi:hypothetical protein